MTTTTTTTTKSFEKNFDATRTAKFAGEKRTQWCALNITRRDNKK
jgi:hypothetical protein